MFLASKSPEITCSRFLQSSPQVARNQFLVTVLFKFFLPSAASSSAPGTSASLRPKTLPPSADDGEWSDLSLPTLDFVQKRGKKCGEKRADVRVKLRREGERKKAIKAFGLIPPYFFGWFSFSPLPHSSSLRWGGGQKMYRPEKNAHVQKEEEDKGEQGQKK